MKALLIALGLVATSINAQKTIYVYAPGWDIAQYFSATGVTEEFNKHNTFFKQVSSAAAIPAQEEAIFFDIDPGAQAAYASLNPEKCILFLWEPPTVKPYNYDTTYHHYFGKIYTWNDALVDNHSYFKMHYPVRHDMRSSPYSFAQKKLCVMITANKKSPHPYELYTQRAALIDFFNSHHPQEFDLYGFGWPHSLRVYKGVIDDKLSCASAYKFSVAYENLTNVPGYVTEKIFDSFISGCVPIYWGAPNITDYVPKSCFIDRTDFRSHEDLYVYLSTMSEETHQKHITAIKEFLMSDSAFKFSSRAFVELLTSIFIK